MTSLLGTGKPLTFFTVYSNGGRHLHLGGGRRPPDVQRCIRIAARRLMIETERVGKAEEPSNQPPRLEAVIPVRSTPPAVDVHGVDVEEAVKNGPLGGTGSVPGPC